MGGEGTSRPRPLPPPAPRPGEAPAPPKPSRPGGHNTSGCRRAASLSRATSFFIQHFESIKRNVAGGGRPPRSLRESSCGDFHCLPRCCWNRPTLRIQFFSCQFFPARPPARLISENARLPPASDGFYLEGASNKPASPGSRNRYPPGGGAVVAGIMTTVQPMTIAGN